VTFARSTIIARSSWNDEEISLPPGHQLPARDGPTVGEYLVEIRNGFIAFTVRGRGLRINEWRQTRRRTDLIKRSAKWSKRHDVVDKSANLDEAAPHRPFQLS